MQRSSVEFKENEPNTVINIAVCGDSGVGKSSLMLRYTSNQFDKFYIVSIAPEKGTKSFKFKENRFTLNFIVFPGDPAYIEDYSSEYAKADCILFVFDFLDKESFNLIIRERNQLLENGNKSVHYFIGNKVESKSKQLIGPDCRKFCEDNKIGYFEISVKENLNIEKTFQKICENFSSAKTSA